MEFALLEPAARQTVAYVIVVNTDDDAPNLPSLGLCSAVYNPIMADSGVS